jgi:glutathione S-transferase
MRARLALFSAQIEYEHREVLLRDKPSTLLELSPKGTVPVLLTGSGKLIEESIDIMKWALNKNDPENLLDIDDENDFNNFVLKIDNDFKKNLDSYKYSQKEDIDKIRSRDNACKFLDELNIKLLGKNWLRGNDPKIFDYALLPFIRQFANVDLTWFDNQPWPNIHKWLNLFLENGKFLAIMYKYKKWEIQHNPIFVQRFNL